MIFHRKCRIGVFIGWNLKKGIAVFEISTLEFFNVQSYMQNKNSYLNFWLKLLYLGTFGLVFEKKNIGIFEISTLEFLYKISSKTKILKFKTKIALFADFWARIWRKSYCNIWNRRPRIRLIVNFGAKMKILKFGTKNSLFGYFWSGIFKSSCNIWNQRPRLWLIAQFRLKAKILKFDPKNALFWVFLDWNLGKVLPYLTSTPMNSSKSKVLCKNESP